MSLPKPACPKFPNLVKDARTRSPGATLTPLHGLCESNVDQGVGFSLNSSQSFLNVSKTRGPEPSTGFPLSGTPRSPSAAGQIIAMKLFHEKSSKYLIGFLSRGNPSGMQTSTGTSDDVVEATGVSGQFGVARIVFTPKLAKTVTTESAIATRWPLFRRLTETRMRRAVIASYSG